MPNGIEQECQRRDKQCERKDRRRRRVRAAAHGKPNDGFAGFRMRPGAGSKSLPPPPINYRNLACGRRCPIVPNYRTWRTFGSASRYLPLSASTAAPWCRRMP